MCGLNRLVPSSLWAAVVASQSQDLTDASVHRFVDVSWRVSRVGV
jgi:hypothetical protein